MQTASGAALGALGGREQLLGQRERLGLLFGAGLLGELGLHKVLLDKLAILRVTVGLSAVFGVFGVFRFPFSCWPKEETKKSQLMHVIWR